jgi:hypothetical protein
MNKLTKIGVSALCGSLAAVSAANAGDLSVTGGVDMSWMSLDGETVGNPIGIGSNVGFSGSGELDNGVGVALSIAYTNKAAYSSTNVTVTFPSLGDFLITSGVSGTGIDRMDDLTPTAWEEAYGHGVGSGLQTVSGGSGGASIEWTPNMLPAGVVARVAWSPDADGSGANDKGISGDHAGFASSSLEGTLTLTSDSHGAEGLTLFGGYAAIEKDTTSSLINDDQTEWTVGANYAVGGFTLGYQYSEEDIDTSTVNIYENNAYGVSFNINDNLTVSYGHYESEKDYNSATADITTEATSIQLAYTVGGASIRLADGEIDNRNYSTAAGDDRDGRTLSVSLAF